MTVSNGSANKELTDTYGIKLVLKYEDGKAKFVSVPVEELSET